MARKWGPLSGEISFYRIFDSLPVETPLCYGRTNSEGDLRGEFVYG
jgi:hypothetical protein